MTHTRTITLELRVDGDGYSGRADDGHSARPFDGRLGLMQTIDELLAEAGTNEEKPMNPTQAPLRTPDAAALRRLIGGPALAPGNDGYDAARTAFNLTVEQHPALIAEPGSREEVAAVVDFARERGLRVAPQRTGHNAEPLGPLGGSILLKTNRLDRVHVDAAARRARVGAGARWEDVVPAASQHGLAALHGSTPDVSVAGYTLGGGMGWYARKHGLAANRVRAIEVVTADGEIRCVHADAEPDLFWALRGGGGNFGVVTALEFDLILQPSVYAGALFFPFERAAEALHAWNEWTVTVPDEVTSVGRLLQIPPLPEIPEPLRGNSFAVVEAVCLTSEAEGAELLAPLRALGPAMDTFAAQPPAGIAELHMDPREPMPYKSAHSLLEPLPAPAIDDLLAVAGPGSGSSLVSVELRHTGGELGRARAGSGAIASIPGEFASFAVGIAADPGSGEKTAEDLARVEAALHPHQAGHYLNFVEREADADGFFPPATAARLREVRDAYDPERLLQSNHEIAATR